MPSRFRFALLLGLALLASPLASLACCPSDGNGVAAKSATTGLGESYPAATDMASDSSWNVYEFEGDGIRYVQVNDAEGRVRAAVGRVDSILWVMPMGVDRYRVSVPGNAVTPPAYSVAQRIYRSAEIEIWRYPTSTGDWWAVRPVSTP